MTRTAAVEPRFVEEIPDGLEDGMMYVSIPYSTVVHLCPCGCGTEIVTPLAPTEWRMIYDGETISLTPSIGSWSSECQSHYWISKNTIRWSTTWTRAEIEAGRRADVNAKAAFYGDQVPLPALSTPNRHRKYLRRLCRLVIKR